MASGYQGGPGSYETSLPDPPAKRHAGSSDFGGSRNVGEISGTSTHHYSNNGQNAMPQDAQNASSSIPTFAMPQQRGSRDMIQAPEQLPYSYAISSNPGTSSTNSPFALLQHPAFAEVGAREASGEAHNAIRAKSEDSSAQRYSQGANYQVTGGQHSTDAGERPLGPGELLPPTAYAGEGLQMAGTHFGVAALPQMPLGNGPYASYAVPGQYSQYGVGVYGAAGVGASSSGGMIGGGSGAPGSPSPPPTGGNGGYGVVGGMRRPEFVAPSRAMYMAPRRHSIAVPSPGHHFGLWAPPAGPDAHEWPASTRSSFTVEDSESQYGADDGSDSDGGEGTSVMVSLRPKDMPPGGPVIEGRYITLLVGPGEHQVKDFNILPINILRINYESKSSDYVVVHLICDLKMKRTTRDIFMTAVSAHHLSHDSKRAVLPALKISQQMLRGRTKGFLFQLRYTLVIDGREVESLHCEPFYLWSNVSQRSFPRHEREAYAMETQDINTKKRRRR